MVQYEFAFFTLQVQMQFCFEKQEDLIFVFCLNLELANIGNGFG